MSDDDDPNKASTGSVGASMPEPGSGLARPLQEHLAQKLRSAYHELAEKPAFLGDPAVPAEFEYHLQRLEAVEKVRHEEKVHNRAVEAVKTALEDIAGSLDSEPSRPTERRDQK
jgi:hypothetical protein